MISCSEDLFCLTNSADPDEMPHSVAFHLDIHCLLSKAVLNALHTYRNAGYIS